MLSQSPALALPGSMAAHAPSSVQATYIATHGPHTLCDLYAAWSHDLRVRGYVSPCAQALDGL